MYIKQNTTKNTHLNSPILMTLVSGKVICNEVLSNSSESPATTCTFANYVCRNKKNRREGQI